MFFIKKIRFIFRLINAFLRIHLKTILTAFLIGVFLAAILPRIISFFNQKKLIRIGISGKFSLTNLPDEVLEKISYGLTTVYKDGSVGPGIADRWEINDDGRLYRFFLKENLFWHNGKNITSKDINYNFSDVLIKKINDQVIEFQLKEPFSPFLTVISEPLFYQGLIGVGNYQVKLIKRNGQIIEKLTLNSKINPNQILIYKFYPTESMLKIAFELGEIDVATGLADTSNLKDWSNLKIKEEIKNKQFLGIIFNTQDILLSNKSIRQALSYSLEKPWNSRSFGPINPDSWAYNPNLKRYDFDIEKAKELFKKGLEEMKLTKGSQVEIELTTFPSFYSLADGIKKYWQQLNVDTKIKIINEIPTEFQAFLVIEDIPPDPDQYLLWHSTQISNLSHFRNPQIDKALEDGRKTQDQNLRKEIYFDFQRFLVENAPVIFLYHPVVYTITRT